MFRRVAVERLAVHLDGHLREDRQIGKLLNSADRLFDERQLGKCFQYEKIYAALEQGLDLLLVHRFGLVERRRSKRLKPKPERADRTGDIRLVTGRLASDLCRGDVDLFQFAFESVRLQLVAGRT